MKFTSMEGTPLQIGIDGAGTRPGNIRLLQGDPPLLSTPRPDAPATVQALFDRYHDKVYGLAMSILMIKSDAEEATQDVFLTVVRNADRFHGNPALHSWINRICVNACLSLLRKGRRTESLPIEEYLPVFSRQGAHKMPVEDWSREGEHRAPDKELGQVIGGFAGELPEKYRVIFALCDLQGFSYEETAQILDLPIAAVKSRLHRARLYLRERLTRYLRDGRAS